MAFSSFRLPSYLLLLLLVFLNDNRVDALSGKCLESKCRGTRIHPWVDNDLELTCWISLEEDVKDPKFCAEGYVGHIVEDVPHEEVDGEMRAWYTCCEPDFDGVAKQSCKYSACSSPDWASGGNCWADGFQEPMSCGDKTYRHPHFTSQKSLIYFQFICCDTPQDGPETQELLISRIIWILLSSITLIVCTTFVSAIVLDKGARSEGWNLYLVFLAIPDAWCNLMIIIRNGLTIPGVPVSPSVHIFFASVEYFYAAANLWLNGVIISQVYYVLRKSSPTKRVPPPSGKTVVKQSAAVYTFSCGAFMWAYYMYARGLIDYSLTTVVNIWISTRALLVLPPLCFCIFVCFDVWWRQLLPRSGRTRVLSLYFLRVIVVFLVTWIPYFILYEVSWNITFSTWMVNISYYLSSIQGTVSVLVALSKPDVYDAVMKLPCFGYCRRRRKQKQRAMRRSHKVVNNKSHTKEASTFSDEISSSYHTKNEWMQEDVWGDMDLDALLEEGAGDGEEGVVIVDDTPEGKLVTIPEPKKVNFSSAAPTIASSSAHTSRNFDEEQAPPSGEQSSMDESNKSTHATTTTQPTTEESGEDWLDDFLTRFRKQQAEQLKKNRAREGVDVDGDGDGEAAAAADTDTVTGGTEGSSSSNASDAIESGGGNAGVGGGDSSTSNTDHNRTGNNNNDQNSGDIPPSSNTTPEKFQDEVGDDEAV